MTPPLDPFLMEVIRHGLSAAAEEMSLVLVRSARSPLLQEAGDLSSTVTDAAGRLPAEMLEAGYALQVERQAIRRGAGGAGRHRGGGFGLPEAA